MNIRLLQIHYKNIREMKDLTLDFCDANKQPKHISLVQMPNGGGKTTTMELIRYCLNGKSNELEEDEVSSFKPQNDEYFGEFEIKISIDDKIYFVGISFDYESSSAKYFTKKTSKESGGKEVLFSGKKYTR